VSDAIDREIGKIARPRNVWIVPDMPTTGSGKIMRRVIAGISNLSNVGDLRSLANPEMVERISEQVQNAKQASGEQPTDLSSKYKEELAAFGKAE
jgi:acetyl-CoA synthetase